MPSSAADARITALFESHYDEVLAYCTRRLGRAEADDAATDVFTVAWRRSDQIQWDTVRPWLYGIARGLIANRYRSSKRRQRLLRRLAGLSDVAADSPETFVVRRDEDNEVLAALRQLRPADREILMLSAWEELTAPEIATALGISKAAAGQRLHRAKGRLAKVLPSSTSITEVSPRAAEQEGGR